MLFRPVQKRLILSFCLIVFTSVAMASGFALPDAKPMRVTISGKTMAQKVKTKVPPVYPAEAKRKGIQEVVRLHVVITTAGTVTQVQAVTGDPSLVRSATEAVKQWIYEPTLLNGQPVEVDTVVEVSFQPKP